MNTEDVAAKVFGYPVGRQRYRWERYEYPDKERVARELRRLKGARGIPFVKGHVNIGSRKDRLDGWMLTAAGVDRIKAIENHVASIVGKASGTHSKYEEECAPAQNHKYALLQNLPKGPHDARGKGLRLH